MAFGSATSCTAPAPLDSRPTHPLQRHGELGPDAGDSAGIDGRPIGSEVLGRVDATGCMSASRPCSDIEPPSCARGGLGRSNCGAGDESCCASPLVPGGTFYRTYRNVTGRTTGRADPASVSTFRLDKYMVTVGRYREFIDARRHGYAPQPASGKHRHLNGGKGLADSGPTGGFEQGWDERWTGIRMITEALPEVDRTSTGCFWVNREGEEVVLIRSFTWTTSPRANENLPVNCASWDEAFAFCIWDGGFLPSQAEWEYAAAGGDEQREFPWGSARPRERVTHNSPVRIEDDGAVYFTLAPVGAATAGAGRWGQLDLVFGPAQWNMDWIAGEPRGGHSWLFHPYVTPCVDCARLSLEPSLDARGDTYRVRSGGAATAPQRIPPASPPRSDDTLGFRCARPP
jgi:formylglycine-generating enzyme